MAISLIRIYVGISKHIGLFLKPICDHLLFYLKITPHVRNSCFLERTRFTNQLVDIKIHSRTNRKIQLNEWLFDKTNASQKQLNNFLWAADMELK